jgi:hypothetical protein
VLRPVFEFTGDRLLLRKPTLAFGLRARAGFVAGFLGPDVSTADRLRLGLSSFLAVPANRPGLFGRLGGELELGWRRAPYLDVESPGAASSRLVASVSLHHGRVGDEALRPVLALWVDRPLGSGRSRDGAALLVRAQVR